MYAYMILSSFSFSLVLSALMLLSSIHNRQRRCAEWLVKFVNLMLRAQILAVYIVEYHIRHLRKQSSCILRSDKHNYPTIHTLHEVLVQDPLLQITLL